MVLNTLGQCVPLWTQLDWLRTYVIKQLKAIQLFIIQFKHLPDVFIASRGWNLTRPQDDY
jgi:hypothetical protein